MEKQSSTIKAELRPHLCPISGSRLNSDHKQIVPFNFQSRVFGLPPQQKKFLFAGSLSSGCRSLVQGANGTKFFPRSCPSCHWKLWSSTFPSAARTSVKNFRIPS